MNQPLVVGYKGEIGSFILNGLLRIMPKALDIWCVDIKETDEEVSTRIKAADVIFLCVPLQTTINWLLKFKILLKNKVIIEQCSLKEWLYENESIKDLDIKSMHILFRPSQTPNLSDRKVGLFLRQFDGQTISDIEEITQSQIIWYQNAEEHDKEMAIQQALIHRTLLILGEILETCKGSTYISQKILELNSRVKKGNKELYKLIQENKYLPEVLKNMKTKFDKFDFDKIFDI
jgi:prephenate dehydrogenase